MDLICSINLFHFSMLSLSWRNYSSIRSPIIQWTCRKYQNRMNLKKYYKSDQILCIEKEILKLLNLYPLNGWKVYAGIIFDFLFMIGPALFLLYKSIQEDDIKMIAFAAPQVLINGICFLSVILFASNYKLIKEFLDLLGKSWEDGESSPSEKWDEIKKNRAKSCNRMSFICHIMLHSVGFVYFYVPTFYYLAQYMFTNSKEKYTVFKVEWVTHEAHSQLISLF